MRINLDRRGQAALVCAFITLWICGALLIFIPMIPQKKFRQSEDRIADLKQQITMTLLMKSEEEERLRRQEKLREQLNARPPTFDLISYLNTQLRGANLAGRFTLENYRTRQSSPKLPMAQLKLTGVSLKELVDVLHTLYASNNLIVMYKLERLHPANNNKGLDCELILATVKV